MSRRYRLLTAAVLKASGYSAVRSRVVPAAAALPRVFGALVNQLAE
jgi:DNA-binding transcriptional regulator YbjK